MGAGSGGANRGLYSEPELTYRPSKFCKYKVHLNMEVQVAEYSSRMLAEIPSLLHNATTLSSDWCGDYLAIYLLIEGPNLGQSLLLLLPRPRRPGARRMVVAIGARWEVTLEA